MDEMLFGDSTTAEHEVCWGIPQHKSLRSYEYRLQLLLLEGVVWVT